MTDNIEGVIAIVIDERGDVVGTGANFERSGYGGFELWEAQLRRAKNAARRNFAVRYMSTIVANVLDDHDIEGIVDSLIRKAHFKLVCRGVGYSEILCRKIEKY